MINPYILASTIINTYIVSLIPLAYFEMKPRHYIISLRVYLFFDVRYYIYFKNYVFAWYIYISCMAANL